jgi:hypothetical protein
MNGFDRRIIFSRRGSVLARFGISTFRFFLGVIVSQLMNPHLRPSSIWVERNHRHKTKEEQLQQHKAMNKRWNHIPPRKMKEDLYIVGAKLFCIPSMGAASRQDGQEKI